MWRLQEPLIPLPPPPNQKGLGIGHEASFHCADLSTSLLYGPRGRPCLLSVLGTSDRSTGSAAAASPSRPSRSLCSLPRPHCFPLPLSHLPPHQHRHLLRISSVVSSPRKCPWPLARVRPLSNVCVALTEVAFHSEKIVVVFNDWLSLPLANE